MDAHAREQLRSEIADKLVEVEDLIKGGASSYRITLLARHISNPHAHVLVTSEECAAPGPITNGIEEAWHNALEAMQPPPKGGE